MAITTAQPPKDAVRKRKVHKKSRQGCSNCKLRRVKCDEAKPECHKCVDYGVDCSYDAKSDGDMQLSVAGSFMLDVPRSSISKAPSLDSTTLNMINNCLEDGHRDMPGPAFCMSEEDLGTLKRFQTRTVCTIGTAETYKIYRGEIVRLASCNPFLMHILLTLTLMHDRCDVQQKKLSVAEAFHWYQGTVLFNRILSRPIKPQERDALWATATLLGAIAFSAVEVNSPEEAWPLKLPSCLDLDWLSISDGKREIARLAYPDRPTSFFQSISCAGYTNLLDNIPDYESDFRALPPTFLETFSLGALSSPDNNPYHKPAAMINVLLPVVCNYSTILSFFIFIGHVPPEYKKLLQEKDPRAMLLLAYWYGKMCEYKQWWVLKRALVECQSICIYLRRYHWQNVGLQQLLKFPISKCGLEGSDETSIKHWMFPNRSL